MNLQKTAERLVKEKNLLKDLSKFGEVFFTGSYKYDLMTNPDIDIYVVNEKGYSFKQVMLFFNKIVLQGKFRSYFIKGDWNDIRIGNTFPNGKYIGFKEWLNDETWKIDVWFVSRKELKRLQSLEPREFNKKEKELILRIKNYRNKKDLRLSGFEIYNKISSKKWVTFADFKKSKEYN